MIGTSRRIAPDLAAFANGAAFRYYDLNDAYVGGLTGHPSDNIAPCLAVAEAERLGGDGRRQRVNFGQGLGLPPLMARNVRGAPRGVVHPPTIVRAGRNRFWC